MAFIPQSSGDDYAPMSEINITPFVDVMLVLLVIFMVAAPLMESGIPIELPKASAKALPKTQKPITLNVTAEKKIYINQTEIDASRLVTELQNYYKERKNKEIFIRADGSLPYSFVAQTMAAVKLAGINKIGLVTLPPEIKRKKGR